MLILCVRTSPRTQGRKKLAIDEAEEQLKAALHFNA
jgi:hypothetical protein